MKAEFYAAVLARAEQLLLAHARQVDGLDEEIALLRVRLRQQLEACGLTRFPLADLDLLLKALRTRHAVCRQDELALSEALAQLAVYFAALLEPAGEGDEGSAGGATGCGRPERP